MIIKTIKKTTGCGIKNNSAANKTKAKLLPATEKTARPINIIVKHPINNGLRLNFLAKNGKKATEKSPTIILINERIEKPLEKPMIYVK